MHMTLFDGSASTVSQVVMGAQVHVGDVVVTVNLMVVPTGGFEYLLGAPTLVGHRCPNRPQRPQDHHVDSTKCKLTPCTWSETS